MADRPEGYLTLPDTVKSFLSTVPNAWDETKLVDGYPGKNVTMARRKGAAWYVGGINAENRELMQKVQLSFLQTGVTYRCTLIADGEHDKAFQTRSQIVNNTDLLPVNWLRRGGFVAVFIPNQ